MIRRAWPGAVLIIVVLALPGCGVYSTSSGRVDEARSRIAVPYLDNVTAQPGLGVELTDLIVEAVQEDNTLKVVSEESANGILEGRVTRYNRRQVSTTNSLRVDEYQVQIAVELTFVLRASGETVFAKKVFTGVGNYFLDDPETTEATARSLAATEIVRNILALIVKDW
jgi:outer membrane lipopolysaccharide assembly protein LptE/RlpB